MNDNSQKNSITQFDALEQQNQFFNEGEEVKTAIEIGEIFFAEATKHFESLPSVKISEVMLNDIYKHVFVEIASFAELREYFKSLPTLEISKPMGESANTVFAAREWFLSSIYFLRQGNIEVTETDLTNFIKDKFPYIASGLTDLSQYTSGKDPIPEKLPLAITNYALCVFRDGGRGEEIALEILGRINRLCPNNISIIEAYRDSLQINAILLATKSNNIIGAIDLLEKAIKLDERINELNNKPLMEG